MPDPRPLRSASSGARPPVIVKPSTVELRAPLSETVVPPPCPSITVRFAAGLRVLKPAANPPSSFSSLPLTTTRSRYVPAWTWIVSPLFAAATAAAIVLKEPEGPTQRTFPPQRAPALLPPRAGTNFSAGGGAMPPAAEADATGITSTTHAAISREPNTSTHYERRLQTLRGE